MDSEISKTEISLESSKRQNFMTTIVSCVKKFNLKKKSMLPISH